MVGNQIHFAKQTSVASEVTFNIFPSPKEVAVLDPLLQRDLTGKMHFELEFSRTSFPNDLDVVILFQMLTRLYKAEILPVRLKTPNNQSINQMMT